MSKLTNKTKLLIAAAVCVVLVLVFVVCMVGTPSGGAKVQGYSGPIEMSAEKNDDGTFTLQVVSHGEDYGLGDLAVNRIADAVNEQQNLDVDIISGATETSAAALDCARRALERAGIDTEALTEPQSGAVEEFIDLNCDVVVVGAGGSGLTAAYTAAMNGSEVVVVEKMGIAGGSTVRSGGLIMAAGTELQIYNGVRDTSASLASYLYALSNREVSQQNRIVALASHSAENIEMLQSVGVQFSDTLLGSEDGAMQRIHLAVDPNGNASGGAIVRVLLDACEEAGVRFVYNTEVYELARDISGAVIGVRGKNNNGSVVTVWADATVIATGGYDRSSTTIYDYNDPGVLPTYSYSAPGSTGDGIHLAEQVGADILSGTLIAELYDFYAGTNGSGGLLVTPSGVRFADESRSALRLGSLIQAAGSGSAWLIVQGSDYTERFDNAVAKGTVVGADTVEELASKLDAPSLAQTVREYNEACAAGVDTAFGKPAAYLRPIETGPFYAVSYSLKSYGTMGGIRTGASGHAVNESGNVPGLFACGEAANGAYLSGTYPGFGASLAQAIESGRTAGLGASEYAKQDRVQEVFVSLDDGGKKRR